MKNQSINWIGLFIAVLCLTSLSCKKGPKLELEKILKKNEISSITAFYKDVIYLHKKNKDNKPLLAVAEIPVILKTSINLDELKINKDAEGNPTGITLPKATFQQPNFMLDKCTVTRERQKAWIRIDIGNRKEQTKILGILKDKIVQRREAVLNQATSAGILEQAEKEVEKYVSGLLTGLNAPALSISFEASSGPEESRGLMPVPDSMQIQDLDLLLDELDK